MITFQNQKVRTVCETCNCAQVCGNSLSAVRQTYSGKYGDLAATTAAILLHDEARVPRLPSDGALREPLLKFIHIMRSLEYKDRDPDRIVILKNLQECSWPGCLIVFMFYLLFFSDGFFALFSGCGSPSHQKTGGHNRRVSFPTSIRFQLLFA